MTNDAFLVLFLAFMIMMCLVPTLLRRWGVPSVIALLLVGMLLGPNGFALTSRLANWLRPLGVDPVVTEQHFTSLIDSLGSLGLIFLMALAGMEADFKMIKAAKLPVIMLSIFTFLLPAVTGFFVFQFFRPHDLPGKLLYASLFASHSVGIVFPVIRELKLTKTKFGAAVLISTVVTDIASILLLAVSVQQFRLANGGIAALNKTLSLFDMLDPMLFGRWFTPLFLAVVVCYLGAAILIVNLLGKLVMRYFRQDEDLLIPVVLLLIMLTALAGEVLGINFIVGAFIAGLSLSKLFRPEPGEPSLLNRMESIGYGFLIPFLFLSIGMKTDFSAFLRTQGNLQIVLLTVFGLVGSKLFSGWFAMRLSGFRHIHGLCAGLMTVPQLSATLAAAAIGRDLGMLDGNFFNAIIILSVVTTLPVPSLVRWIIEHGEMRFTRISESAYDIPEEDNEML